MEASSNFQATGVGLTNYQPEMYRVKVPEPATTMPGFSKIKKGRRPLMVVDSHTVPASMLEHSPSVRVDLGVLSPKRAAIINR